MRDYVVLAIILGSVPFALLNPYYGLLIWNWVAFFNPHRYTWGFAYNFPVAQAIGIPTLLGLFFFRQKKNRLFVRETVVLLVFWAWCALIALYSSQASQLTGHSAEALSRLEEISKILLMTYVTVLLVTSREKLRWLALVVALSFGIRAIIVTNFGIATGGNSRIYGPHDSFIADNNAFGLALNMALPMLFFLRWDVSNRYLLWLLRIAVPATIFSVILTYSRGDLVGLCVVLFGIALKSRRKLVAFSLLGTCTFLVLAFAPARWMDRMNNFAEGNLDRSAQERLDTWQFTLNFVEAYPLTGGSFGVFEDINVKRQYAPPHLASEEIFGLSGPHSIYFQILGEQGIIGLVLYLCLMGSCLMTLRRLRKRAGRNPDKAWVIPYCNMLEMGILAFAVSGATLGVAYFDLYFTLVALTSAIAIICRRQSAVMENSAQIAPVEELQPMFS